jgi:hypothetical protein
MTAIANHPHRVTSAIADTRVRLASVAQVPVWSMDAIETTAAIADVQAAKAQLAEVEARLLSHATRIDIPATTAASSTANWHAVATTTTRAQAHRTMRLADGLETHDLTRAALAGGAVHVEQAEVILRALEQLPDDLDPDLTAQAEQELLAHAQHFDAKALKVLGRRILEVVSPETADAHEAALLEQEERAAAAATRLTMYDDGHGKVHGRFTLDTLTGAMLKKAHFATAATATKPPSGPSDSRADSRVSAARLPSGSDRRSPSSSSATRSRSSPRPVASTPPSWSSCSSTP